MARVIYTAALLHLLSPVLILRIFLFHEISGITNDAVQSISLLLIG